MISTILSASGAYTETPGLLEYIEKKSAFSDAPRSIGWDLLKSACKILDGVFEAFNRLLDLNFYEIPGIKNFVSKTSPIAWACFGIAIVIGAIFLMINKDKLKISDFTRNVLISAALIVALPFIFSVLTDMKNAGVSDMKNELQQNETLGKTILASVTVDIENSSANRKISTLLDAGVNSYSINVNDTLGKGTWKYEVKTKQIDLSDDTPSTNTYADAIKEFFELSDEEYNTYYSLPTDQRSDYFKNNLQRRLANLKNNNEILNCNTLEEVYALYPASINKAIKEDPRSSMFGGDYLDASTGTVYYFYELDDGDIPIPGDDIHIEFLEEYIYAYKYDFLMGFLLVIVTIVALFFAGFKVVSLMFDLVFNQIIAPIVFATDLQGSGRTKKMIENIFSSYLVFIIILVLVKLYLEINIWAIQNLTETKDIFIKLIILVGTAKCVIDGPDIIVKLLGMDAGVKSGAAAMLGIQSGLRFAGSFKNMGSNIIHAPSNIGKAVYNRATNANPIRNAQNYMRRARLDKEKVNQEWQAFKNNKSSGTAQPRSNSNQSSDKNSSDTAKPKV